MNDQIISWLIVAEIALPLLILSSVLAWVLFRSAKKNKEAARGLILKIKNNEDNERAAVMSFLTDKLSFEEDAAKKATKKIINERKFLFRNLISGLLDKNLAAIESLESDMSRITRRYHDLDVVIPQETEEAEEIEDNSAQIEELTAEIKSLKKEVHITLTTLNNIFAEFSSMFGEEVPDSEMSVDQIINAMEAFSGKSATVQSNEQDLARETEPDAFAEVDETPDEGEREDDESAIDALDAVDDQGDVFDASEPLAPETQIREEPDDDEAAAAKAFEEAMNPEPEDDKDTLDFSIDEELDDIDSALDELELGSSNEAEPSWDDAFEESGDKTSNN
ncbi:hypothetical protein FLL45_03350 [Aliikangiella marina]|uniref:Uncharacterized protein n=1 Tax=Aliikangiella marina TaxID=1712262 RepID=A0A545TIH0_9GAMM|nr:hypothetical protein [Aliikangiella marina]TQV77003.1 hypothetical protein FLL45_03350 [Aliikangiella marina]